MNEKDVVRLSKRLSNWLRHNPDAIGLSMDSAGWVLVEDLLQQAAAHGRPFTRAALETVVEQNNKRRFEFDESGALIRARQGHSVRSISATRPPNHRPSSTTARPSAPSI